MNGMFRMAVAAGAVLLLASACHQTAHFRADQANTGVYSTQAVRQSGEVKWRVRTDAWVRTSPVFFGKHVYFGTLDGTLFAVDIHTGEPSWSFQAADRISSSPAIANGTLFFGSFDHNL